MKKEQNKINKEDFINYLAQATPEELNKLIVEKGKPPKLIEPIFFFDKYKNKIKQY